MIEPRGARVHSDGDLPSALRALKNTVHDLTEPRPHTVIRDFTREYQRAETVWLDSWYECLRTAVAGQTGARSGGRNTLPLWTDALDLLHEIDTAVQAWHPQRPVFDGDLSEAHPPTPVTILRLRGLQARKWRPQDVRGIEQITQAVTEWCTEIEELLSGVGVRFLYAAESKHLAKCPACDADIVRRQDSSGETVRQPALQLHADGSTHCINCRYTWGPERMQLLAAALGYPLPKGCVG